jgi:hypothetical protein
MKKTIFLMFCFIFSVTLQASPSSSEYVIRDIDEMDSNRKIYGLQLENGTNWYAIEITTSSVGFVKGTSTSTYNDWFILRKSTATVYRDGFSYQKHNYPN